MLTRIERQNVPLAPLPISILFCNQTTSHRLHSDARPHFHAGSSVAAPPLPDRAIIIIVTLTSPRETGQKNSELELQPATTRRRGTFPMPANYPARRPSLSAVSGATPTGTPYLPLVSGGGRAGDILRINLSFRLPTRLETIRNNRDDNEFRDRGRIGGKGEESFSASRWTCPVEHAIQSLDRGTSWHSRFADALASLNLTAARGGARRGVTRRQRMRKWRLGISCNLGIVRQFSAECRPPRSLACNLLSTPFLFPPSAGDKIMGRTRIDGARSWRAGVAKIPAHYDTRL